MAMLVKHEGWPEFLNVVDIAHVTEIDKAVWEQVHQHPIGASCSCVTAAVADKLHELGYEVIVKKNPKPTKARK